MTYIPRDQIDQNDVFIKDFRTQTCLDLTKVAGENRTKAYWKYYVLLVLLDIRNLQEKRNKKVKSAGLFRAKRENPHHRVRIACRHCRPQCVVAKNITHTHNTFYNYHIKSSHGHPLQWENHYHIYKSIYLFLSTQVHGKPIC